MTQGDLLVMGLAGASVLWVAVHAGIAGTAVRRALVARLTERGFLVVFSVASVVAIALLIAAWKQTPPMPLWFAPVWLRWLLVAAMLPAFILFAGSVSVRSPTAVGGVIGSGEPRGMLRVTRHPMLCSFGLWAAVHIVANGDGAAGLLFGAFLVTALVGMPSIDAKVAARDPAGWRRFAAVTSIVPFAAILAGRNRLVLRELVWPVAGGAVAWAAMLALHPAVVGVAAVPG